MLKKLMSILSSLLIIAGLLVPTIPAFADQSGSWSISSGAVSYQDGNTVITYNVNVSGTANALSHYSIQTCFTSDPGITSSSDNGPTVSWMNKDGSWENDEDNPYSGPVVKSVTGSEQSFAVTVTYPGLWQTTSGKAFAKFGSHGVVTTVTVPDCSAPKVPTKDFTISKSASPTAFEGAQTVTYSYTFTNTGEVPLDITSAVDSRIGDIIFSPSTVLAGGTATATGTETFAALADGSEDVSYTNVITVKASYAGTEVDTKQAQATVIQTAPPLRGAFAVTKTASPTALKSGGPVTYTYSITNTGSIPLTIVSTSDDKIEGVSTLFSGVTLDAGETETRTATKTFPVIPFGGTATSETNTFTVTVNDGIGDMTKTATATVANNPLEKVNLTSICTTAETNLHTWRVTNPNNQEVTVVWTVLTGGSGTGTLTVPASDVAFFETISPQAAGTTVNVKIEIDGYKQAQKAANNNLCSPPTPTPSFTVDKTASTDSLPGGAGEVTYTYSITNTGNVDLSISSIADDMIPEVAGLFPSTIGAGNTITRTASKTFAALSPTDAQRTEVNTFTVTATYEEWEDTQEDTASVLRTPPAGSPAITVAKTADRQTLTGAGTITYTYTITNSGNVPLVINSAVDDKIATLTLNDFNWPTEEYILQPNASVTASDSRAFAAIPPDSDEQEEANIFTATGIYNQQTVSDDATVTVTLLPVEPDPDFEVTKTATPSSLVGGGTVTYIYTIKNTGNVDLAITDVLDDKIDTVDVLDFFPEDNVESWHILTPNQTVTFSTTKSFPNANLTETNTFEVVGFYQRGERELTRTAAATITVTESTTPPPPPPPTPDVVNFTVTKSASTTNDPATGSSSVSLNNGGTVYYFYTVTNTGTTPLVITEATDDKLGNVAFTPNVVSVGGTATATMQKTFGALSVGSAPQVETNTISVTGVWGSTTVGPKTASASVTNNAPEGGTVTVRVFDNSPRNEGVPQPIHNADVSLSNGMTGHTNASGEIVFNNLVYGSYSATGSSVDPVTGVEPQSGDGSTSIDSANPDGVINILLSWTPALVGITSLPPVPVEPLGKITVLVLDGSPRNNGNLLPIPGADVMLAGIKGKTNADGLIVFDNLEFADYTALAEAIDPMNPTLGEKKSGSGSTPINLASPEGQITIVLMWDPPLASATAVGSLQGRICAPRAPGAEIVATHESGVTAQTFIAATGILGAWMDYALTNLIPGKWTVTLNNPGDAPAEQTVTVVEGQAVQVSDFTLACTGAPAPMPTLWIYYAIGALMVMAGLYLRRFGKAEA